MAIGRISGQMLVADLERDGIDLSIDGNLIYFDVTNRTVTIGSDNKLYTLPNTAPPTAKSILYAEGAPSLKTYWAPAPPYIELARKKYTVNISNLPGYGFTKLDLPLGVSSIVYNLNVSRPCKVEVFGTRDRTDVNPYTFIATEDHLADDGTVILNDGSSFQSRQYSIFANLEDPPRPMVYATITSIDPFRAGEPVILDLTYYVSIQG